LLVELHLLLRRFVLLLGLLLGLDHLLLGLLLSELSLLVVLLLLALVVFFLLQEPGRVVVIIIVGLHPNRADARTEPGERLSYRTGDGIPTSATATASSAANRME
jgi:hypothetical protein